MKIFLLIVTFLALTLTLTAQQTEDEVHVGSYPKGKTFGNYKGPTTKPVEGQTAIMGVVVKLGWCEDDCLTMILKKDDGSLVTVGTKDYGFTVSKKMVGSRVIVEGLSPDKLIMDRKRKTLQKDIQFAATGIKII